MMHPLLYLQIWVIKTIFHVSTAVQRTLKPAPAWTRPTLLKSYPVRPGLKNRIFIPKTYAKADGLLPLYLDVHGGGFALLDPEIDDEFCSYVANTFSVLVVSMNYHKTPSNAFPGPVEDVATIATAVITDPSLPIDRSRIAMGGFSAGGNMSLGITQKPELHGLIKAIVCFYPPTDFFQKVDAKLPTKLTEDKSDELSSIHPLFEYAYFGPEVDQKNPLLSPLYAKSEDLSEWMYIIGAEDDMLCVEARSVAELAAGLSSGERGSRLIPGVKDGDGWEEGKVRWEVARGQGHNFTHNKKPDEADERARAKYCEELYARAFQWLRQGAWAKVEGKC